MEAQSLGSHQHSWWFSCFSLREKLARSHNKKGFSKENPFWSNLRNLCFVCLKSEISSQLY